MAVRGTITLTGAAELRRKLKDLEPKVARKLLRQALRAGAKVTQERAKELAPVETGQLRKSIKVRAMTRLKRGTLGIKVQTGAGDFKGDEFYGSFIEFGWHHGSRKLGDARKLIPPKPYMRPAFDETKDKAVQIVTDTLRSKLAEEAKKL